MFVFLYHYYQIYGITSYCHTLYIFSFISSFLSFSSLPSFYLSLPLDVPFFLNFTLLLSHLIIFMSGATSAFCFTHSSPITCICKAGYVQLACSIAFCNSCLPEEMLYEKELSTWSSLFEHVQCAIMLDHLFLLRGW